MNGDSNLHDALFKSEAHKQHTHGLRTVNMGYIVPSWIWLLEHTHKKVANKRHVKYKVERDAVRSWQNGENGNFCNE